MKICCRCKEEKSREHFTADKRAKDGLISACKQCVAAAQRQRRIDKTDQVREYDKLAEQRKRDKDPVEYNKRAAERQLAYRRRNGIGPRQLLDPFEAELRYKERQRLNAKIQKAKHKRNAPFDEEAIEYAQIIINDPCSYCGGPGGTVDHIVPVNSGGSSVVVNLTGACQPCNASKQDVSMLTFLARITPYWKLRSA